MELRGDDSNKLVFFVPPKKWSFSGLTKPNSVLLRPSFVCCGVVLLVYGFPLKSSLTTARKSIFFCFVLFSRARNPHFNFKVLVCIFSMLTLFNTMWKKKNYIYLSLLRLANSEPDHAPFFPSTTCHAPSKLYTS